MAERSEGEQNDERQKLIERRMKALQIEQQKRNLVKRFMTIEAYERLMNVRVANFELYSQLLDLIISSVQSNRVTGQITEAQLKDILARMTYKSESRIEFKHK
ncbi:MAG: hypothetical protein KGH67_01050 [Candidatus Micrarchaeota archaeon]|nr:hypothetical protein [Candidatus Micrarchaeota archaeon]